jgi:hypothetical protein
MLIPLWFWSCVRVGTVGSAGQPEAVPVFLPGERVDCLFEVIGEVSVRGPFRTLDDGDGRSRDDLMRGVRLAVGREGAEAGAHAVMVREVEYREEPTAVEDNTPEIVLVEGMLLSFVDPTCVPSK